MAGKGYTRMSRLLVFMWSCLFVAGAVGLAPRASRSTDSRQADARRSQLSRCVSCSVNGKLYDGHSRFQYEEGCNRYRCICRCDGSWECPAQYTEDICGDSAPSQDRHSSSSQGGDTRCRTCVVNGQEYQGRSYFTFVEGCLTIDNCVCNCNGSWVCPKERARSTCEGDTSLAKIATWTVEIENSQSSSSGSSSSHSGSSSSRSGSSSSGSGNSGSSSRSSFSSSSGTSFSSHESSSSGSSGGSSCNSCGETGISSSSSQDTSSQDRTSARRTDDRRQTHRGCQDCTALGKVFNGNSYFELEDGCRKMKNCICYCNGSWNCPDRFVENSCLANNAGTTRQPSGCRSCTVKGNTFPGNQHFQFLDGCIEYRRCICNCDGSWNCPGSSARNVCGQGGANTVDTSSGTSCRHCEIKGQVFPGNQYFELTDGCLEYKNCICRCDGSWSCPDSGARNKCQDKGGVVDTSSCRNCEVYGSTFPGNQYFQVKHGCIEYQNCICRCDGSWSCPGDSARNTCVGEGSSSSKLPSGNDGGGPSVAQCLSCLAFGKNFTGGDYFDVVDGCTSYRNCVCRCDGSWDCNSRFATNICTTETRVNEERRGSQEERVEYRNTSRTTSENQCSVCNTRSKVVRGNTYFEMMDGCLEYKNCLCRCDGSWECPSQYARNICTVRPSTASPTRAPVATCSNCHAKGKIVKGNTYFELIDGCTRYTSCRCNCDGRWDCPADRSQNICFTNTTMSDNRCSMCKSSDGRVHHPNTKFQLVEDCIEYNCDCFCNGSWSCPGKSSRWVCQDRCLQCDVNGRKYQNNTQFVHRTGCLEYTCNCHCNGSWSCPGSSARNTCPAGVRDNCNKCIVSPSEVYEGESDFILRQDCLHYKCRCNCDGSYSCPGNDARNVCRGEVLGGCKSCAVSETETHRGETDFTMRKDCIHYECRCNCDGSWECPAERARNICLGEVPGGCRVCRVSETENYRPNTVFDMRKGCINYKCKCNCDGGWSCPGEDARDVCKGEVPGGCRSCIVSENEFYPGNSNFEMVKSCIHYKCRCNCDGSYSCPGQTARRVCQAGSVAEAPTCRKCRVSEREQFDGNTTFNIDRGCIRYECDCRCDGSWQCPPGKSRDTCASDAARVTRPPRCNTCKISNEMYPGNSSFKFTRGCSQFDCRCECSGWWSCDYKKPTNICRGRNQVATERSLTSDGSAVRTRQDITDSGSNHNATRTTERGRAYVETDIRSHESTSQTRHGSRTSSSSDSSSGNADGGCRPCPTHGLRVEPNGQISIDHGCRQYRNCKCLCDGGWRCAEDTNRCGPTQTPVLADGQRSHRTETQSSSSTSQRHEVDSSAWVFVDGADTSFKTRNEQTGGGYLVQVDTKYSPTYSANNENRRQLELLESRPSSSSSFSASGSSSMSSSFTASGSSPDVPASSSSSSFEGTGNNQCLRCQVDSKTYQAGAYFDMRRGCVIYKCLCLCSGSYRCRLTSDNECSMQDKQNTCSNCLYQGMVFPGNMGFTVREGCEEKQCSCNCDGTHACHTSKPIPGCTDASANAPSFPGYGNFYPIPGGLVPAGTGYVTNAGRTVFMTTCTTCQESFPGPVVYHTPVRPTFGEGGGGFGITDQRFNVGHTNPRETCSGCVVDGQVRRGNSTFTFEKDCMEFDCFCACGGSWKCSGRLSPDCSPGFVPDTVPHTSGCRSCVVQGTTYPANARFALRQGCHEYQCSCNCDGGWSCPAQHPVDLCPTAPARPNRGNVMDPQIVREDLYVADQGVSGANLVQDRGQGNQQQINSKHHTTAPDPCHECAVRGTTYAGKSRFFLRDGCIQRTCECHCNRTWSCTESVVDICRAAEPDASTLNSVQCRVCRVGSDTFVSDKDFQINNGCHQHNCYCYCNGTFDCPPERARNICPDREETRAAENTGSGDRSTGRVLSTLMTKENGDAVIAGKALGCKECNEDGQKIEALSTFVRQLGCYESLCQCQCNGKSFCPPSASVNVCELPDKKPMNERKGCQVGLRTHFTRVFAHVEDCIQRTCLCHDNGEWSCKRTPNDIKVC